MMGVDHFNPADLTCLLFQLACLYGSLHSKMSIIFGWIRTTPICLAGVGFQHRRILLLCKIALTSSSSFTKRRRLPAMPRPKASFCIARIDRILDIQIQTLLTAIVAPVDAISLGSICPLQRLQWARTFPQLQTCGPSFFSDGAVAFVVAETFLRNPRRPSLSLCWFDPDDDEGTRNRLARRGDKIGLHGTFPSWLSGLL